ncbi:MAG TPA: helix-turn-helix transcriptional regulator [Longimicrobium sp.]|nr:helix-turn-helix transcriptional regulator [Longimicrobium sp.]
MSSNEHLHAESTRFKSGSGNVFADLGLPDPEEALAKAGLAREIADTIDRRGLTEGEATRIMGLDQPKASDLLRGRLAGFSSDRLRRALLALRAPLSECVRESA